MMDCSAKVFVFVVEISLRKHAHATYGDFHGCKNDNFQLNF